MSAGVLLRSRRSFRNLWLALILSYTGSSLATALLGHSAGFYVVRSLLWAAAIVAVFAPIAVARFRRG